MKLNTIHNCDYLELLRSIPSESAAVVITDPPYGINYQNTCVKGTPHKVLESDAKPFKYTALANEAFRILKLDAFFFAFTGWSSYPKHYAQISRTGLVLKEPLIGRRREINVGNAKLSGTWSANTDWILFAHKGKPKFKPTKLIRNKCAGLVTDHGGRLVKECTVAPYKTKLPSCWHAKEFPSSSEGSSYQKAHSVFHPTIKGLRFIKWLILISTDPGDLVVDPFMGSGTTAVAAKQLGRRFIGSEIDPVHYKTAMDRLRRTIVPLRIPES